jgi:hypothetical protein
MTRRTNETKRTFITAIAIIISVIVALALFATARSSRLPNRPIGGEIMFIFLPLITYFTCKNITLSIDVFSELKEDDCEDLQARVISKPKRYDSIDPNLKISINPHHSAEDYTR